MNEKYPPPKYAVRLFIRHPDIDPNEITEAFGLEPSHAWATGSPKVLPNGNTLPGRAKNSYWNYKDVVVDNNNFPKKFERIISILEKNKNFIEKIKKTYGEIEMDLQFYGGAHIGNVIDWDQLKRMVKLKINLGIEVFPNWD